MSGTSPRRSPRRVRRTGAAAVELAIVLMVLLTLIFGMIELSMAVFRYNNVSGAARRLLGCTTTSYCEVTG